MGPDLEINSILFYSILYILVLCMYNAIEYAYMCKIRRLTK